MCGIAGILPFDGFFDKKKLHEMVSSIAHRGPDQKNIFQNSLGVFGFLRLKIIDLSDRSNQPLLSKDKKIQLIYNGEIYNFKELKKNTSLNPNFILMVMEKLLFIFMKNLEFHLLTK